MLSSSAGGLGASESDEAPVARGRSKRAAATNAKKYTFEDSDGDAGSDDDD